MATTRSTATEAPTRRCWEPATTPSSGIPGDGSDKVEGQAGNDTMVFNGAAAAENFEFSANGNRLRFFRTQGAITMDTAGVDRVDLNALGGSDNTVVNDLSATDVKNIVLDLATDGAVDTTTINGTAGTTRSRSPPTPVRST
jgi:Ca2+-binding RTX toxin-like protein